MKKILLIAILLFISCNQPKDKRDLGLVKQLPKGKYIIWNTGSRHIIKCLNEEGNYYWLNDANFDINGIEGHDAHQYTNMTEIVIE